MSATNCEFRALRAEDLPGVISLLKACGLPTDDLVAVNLEDFELAEDAGGHIVGLAGFDRAGSDALLRSLAVAPDWRGRGLGEALVARRAAAARLAGVSAFYLLTTSAADYFRRLGYRDVTRVDVPSAIAAHAQFRSLCPASATCLAKRL
ncbi:MAG: family N-acetyltransferase [Proteobacteria bacterium]|nr:family N-acetyltransferase [Pseudomonadota bacterium]